MGVIYITPSHHFSVAVQILLKFILFEGKQIISYMFMFYVFLVLVFLMDKKTEESPYLEIKCKLS